MKIQFRTSGGRGEYEVAGQYGEYTARNLIDKDIYLDLRDWGVKDSGVYVREDSGKTRMRIRPGGTTHVARQMAAAFLMPRMVRSAESGGAGARVMLDEQYSFRALDCSNVVLQPSTGGVPGTATMTFETMSFNNDIAEDRLVVSDRIRRIARAHAAATMYPSPLDAQLTLHGNLVNGPGPYSSALEELVQNIMASVAERAPYYGVMYIPGGDPLPALEAMHSLPALPDAIVDLGQIAIPEVRKRETQERRLAAARSAEAFAFARNTRAAYRDTCLFCGLSLPKGGLRRGGVDGMHILPHSDYDMNHVCNGICGCKLDHWAFDEGLIMLRYNQVTSGYEVWVTTLGVTELGGNELARFRTLEGPVDPRRLPADPSERPAPAYLDLFNELMGNVPAA